MSTRKHIVRKLRSRLTRDVYLLYQKLHTRLYPVRQLNILVSNGTNWADDIKHGFTHTKHQVEVADIMSTELGGYDLVVPLTIEDIEFLDQEHASIKQNLIPLPDINAVKLCDSKDLFNQHLIENGFGDYIPAIGETNNYPFILKKKIDAWGKNTHIIRNSLDKEKYKAEIISPEYFCQEMVTGKYEFATHILYMDGKIQHSLNIQYYFEVDMPIKGQDSFVDLSITSCPYLEIFSSILKLIDYEGLCCFNYKIKDNRPLILEINPRFGGSLAPYFFSFISHIPNIKNLKH